MFALIQHTSVVT